MRGSGLPSSVCPADLFSVCGDTFSVRTHLITRTQILQRELSGVDLVLADDERKPRAGLAGRLQRFFQLERLVAQSDDHALTSQLARQLSGSEVHACAEGSDIDIGGAGGGAGGLFLRHYPGGPPPFKTKFPRPPAAPPF